MDRNETDNILEVTDRSNNCHITPIVCHKLNIANIIRLIDIISLYGTRFANGHLIINITSLYYLDDSNTTKIN